MSRARASQPRPGAPVRETDLDGARAVIEEAFARRDDVESDETARQLAGFRSVLEREGAARFFVAEVDGRQASVCELYLANGVGQIEDVNTLEEFRGRGLASAVVLAAAEAARSRRCDLVFLVADEADWPKALYARLGFDPVATYSMFLRTPA
jgi:ribosomal protein S18 acetylase RimI-like enzyme